MTDLSLEREAISEAADPATPLSRLSELARDFPAVRPIIAINPSTYEALLDWLKALDDPAVTEALNQRAALASAGVAPGLELAPATVAASVPVASRASLRVWLVAGSAVLGFLALGAVLAFVLLIGLRASSEGASILSIGQTDEQQIEQVLSIHLSGLETYDCALMESTTTADYRAQNGYECQDWHSKRGDAIITISSTTDSISVDGNTATAVTHGTWDVRANPLAENQSIYVNGTWELEKVDGTWLVSSASVSQY